MSHTPTIQKSYLTIFREFTSDLREEKPYFPVYTESKGFLNISLGSASLLVSIPMVVSDSYFHSHLANLHVKIGSEAVRQGIKEFLPGAITAAVAYWFLT